MRRRCLSKIPKDEAFRKRGRASAALAQCISRNVQIIKAQAEEDQKQLSEVWPRIEQHCLTEMSQFSENLFTSAQKKRGRHRRSDDYKQARFECYLQQAVEEGCEPCIFRVQQELGLQLSKSLIQSVADQISRYQSGRCYNKYAQGEMACQVIFVVGYSGRMAPMLARKLGDVASRDLIRHSRNQIKQRERVLIGVESLDEFVPIVIGP